MILLYIQRISVIPSNERTCWRCCSFIVTLRSFIIAEGDFDRRGTSLPLWKLINLAAFIMKVPFVPITFEISGIFFLLLPFSSLSSAFAKSLPYLGIFQTFFFFSFQSSKLGEKFVCINNFPITINSSSRSNRWAPRQHGPLSTSFVAEPRFHVPRSIRGWLFVSRSRWTHTWADRCVYRKGEYLSEDRNRERRRRRIPVRRPLSSLAIWGSTHRGRFVIGSAES